MSGRKMNYKRLTVREKLKIIEKLEKGESTSKLSREFGVGESTVRDIKKQKEVLIKFSAKCDRLSSRKSMKTSNYENLDEAMLRWFNQKRSEGIPVSGPMCVEQAKRFHTAFGLEGDFKASSGWLTRFKKRYGIRDIGIHGERLSADSEAAKTFAEEFKLFVDEENLDQRQIYNADETGLYWKCLPSRTLAMEKEKQAPGRKTSKERITIMACANATGDHKLKLLAIGKSKTPRCFISRDVPLLYFHQKSAWMNAEIFKDWFHNHFVKEVRAYLIEQSLPIKAVLLLDNAPSHPNESELKYGDIFVKFLPPNVTSVIQPMDQGVLAALKKNYRSSLLQKLVEENVDIKTFWKEFTLLDALCGAKKSWEKVNAVTLARSWRSILSEVQDNIGFSDGDVSNAETTVSKMTSLLRSLEECKDAEEDDIVEWLAVDENDQGYSHETEDDIIRDLTCDDEDGANGECDDENSEVVKVVHSEASAAVDTLLSYVENRDEFSFSDIVFLRNLRCTIRKNETSSKKQKKMTDFVR